MVDLGYMINHAMFQRNGRMGYVLKPLALRTQGKAELARRTEHSLDLKVSLSYLQASFWFSDFFFSW